MNDSFAIGGGTTRPACSPAGRVTRSLLGYGVVAGPLYVGVVLGQALLRPGFDLTRDDASLLSNGSLGWIQIANFILTGLCVIACAVGLARALRGGKASTWAPRLLAVYGVALLAAGVFVADPMNGFPAGAPAGRPDAISLHGMLHIVAAGVGFACFIASCFVLARRFAAERLRAMTGFSVGTGIVFLAAFAGVASGSGSPAIVLGFWAALLAAWTWMATVAIYAYRRTS